MEKNEKRLRYLNRSADTLCKAAYELCRDSYGRRKEKPPDAKQLKDVCAAVKDVLTIANSVSGEKDDTGQIRILVESAAEELAE